MKKFFVCLFSVLFCLELFAADDPVVMTVNGKDILMSEFMYFFNRNNTSGTVNKKTVSEYANLYLNFKLKVEDAIENGLDKSESFLSAPSRGSGWVMGCASRKWQPYFLAISA